jgi:anti-sigma factor RsiW
MKLSEQDINDLFDYLDGKLSGEKKNAFEYELRKNAELRSTYNDLRKSDQIFRENLLEVPPPGLTQRVMANLYTVPASNNSSLSIRKTLLLLGAILSLVALCALLLASGIFDSTVTTFDLNQVTLVKKYVDRSLPSFGINGKLLVHIVVFLNLVIALMVLDRSVLKPLFQRRLHTGG